MLQKMIYELSQMIGKLSMCCILLPFDGFLKIVNFHILLPSILKKGGVCVCVCVFDIFGEDKEFICLYIYNFI